MATALELLKRAEGTVLTSRGGKQRRLTLLPPLNANELHRLETQLPCPIPADIRELFQYTRGFEGPDALKTTHGEFTEVDLSGLEGGFGLEEVFPHALSIAGDGSGNFWVIDLDSSSKSWGPVFYACHDAPVIVYQTNSLSHFIEDLLKGSNPPWKSEIEDVHGQFADRIWRENPGVLSFEQVANSKDEELRAFARSLDTTYEFVDLRSPKLGDGFSWGRYGRKRGLKRFGEKRIFANPINKSRWQKFKDALK
jgi:SMI1 / KNR4 family (SUKH-1)